MREDRVVSSEENKAIVRRFFEQAWSKGELDVVDEVVATAGQTPPDQLPAAAGVKETIRLYRAGLPDLVMSVEDQVAEGDKVVTRFIGRGTHRGEFMGIAPTNKLVTVHGMSLYRLSDGRIVEGWDSWDKSELTQQLGATPHLTNTAGGSA